MLRPVFSALSLTTKLPNPLKYTLFPFAREDLMDVINASTALSASTLSNPVSSAMSATISAFVIFVIFLIFNIEFQNAKLVDEKVIFLLSAKKINYFPLMNDFHLQIARWYRLNKRDLPWRNTNNPYFIWLSEIILQQTRVNQGLSYYHKFINAYPTVKELANSDEKSVLNNWQGLGYYSRARNLHSTAKFIVDELNGIFPVTFEELLQLKGVGKYTAAAIASFSNNEPVAVVDGNVYRVLSRYFNINLGIDTSKGQKYFYELAQELIPRDNAAEHNQAIMEFGALVCTPKQPKCIDCPLIIGCAAYKSKTVSLLPVKEKKLKIKNRYFHYMIFREGSDVLVEQRTQKDIWEKLYQFPLIETSEDKTLDVQQTYELNATSISENKKHVLSHQHLYVKFYHFDKFPVIKSPTWETINENQLDEIPLPRIIDKYVSEMYLLD